MKGQENGQDLMTSYILFLRKAVDWRHLECLVGNDHQVRKGCIDFAFAEQNNKNGIKMGTKAGQEKEVPFNFWFYPMG